VIAAADADAVDVEDGVPRRRGPAHVRVELGLEGEIPIEMAVGGAVEGELDRLVLEGAPRAELAEDVVDVGVGRGEMDGERSVLAPQTGVRGGGGGEGGEERDCEERSERGGGEFESQAKSHGLSSFSGRIGDRS
jgi:hypothetical protein